MIPRQTGLVPEIRAPAHVRLRDAAATRSNDGDDTRRAAVRVERYPMVLSSVAAVVQSSKQQQQQQQQSSVLLRPSQLQLYSFVRSVDCPVAPARMMVEYSHTSDGRDMDAAAAAGAGTVTGSSSNRTTMRKKSRNDNDDNDDDEHKSHGDASDVDDDDDDGASGDDDNKSSSSSSNDDDDDSGNEGGDGGDVVVLRPDKVAATATTPAATTAATTRKRARAYKHTRRVFLRACALDASRACDHGGSNDDLRLSSIVIPEYEHLDCVLVQLPAAATPQDDGDSDGSSSNNVSTQRTRACTALPLPRPLRELRVARGPQPPRIDGASISTHWQLSASSSAQRVRASDWKSMDALDREANAMGARSRWEVEEASVGAGATDKDDHTATATADKTRATRCRLPVAQLVRRPATTTDATTTTTTDATTTTTAATRDAATTTANAATSTMMPPPPPARRPQQQQQQQQQQAQQQQQQPQTMAECGGAVLAQLRHDGRATATLKELEKLVLKRLPDYAAAAANAKSDAHKAQAVRWFRDAQRALRQWLLECGHTIDAAGNVRLLT